MITSGNVAPSSSPLSQSIKYGNLLFLSVQIDRNPDTVKLKGIAYWGIFLFG